MNWQSIETAPKDGTHIILSNGADVSCGEWLPPSTACDNEWEGGWSDWMGGMNPPPTHWMPLPTTPTTQPQAKGELDKIIGDTDITSIQGADNSLHAHLIDLYSEYARKHGLANVEAPDYYTYGKEQADKACKLIADRVLLAGHDLTKVAAVDKSVLDAVKETLEGIVNAQSFTWDDPEDFEGWAKSRSRDALAKLNSGGTDA